MSESSRAAIKILSEVPEGVLEDVLGALKDGAQTLGDVLGITKASLNSVERIAQAYYSTHQFAKAAGLYAWVLQLDETRASAWRGLGACSQASREFGKAGRCYRQALVFDPGDVPSSVFWAECLCQVGLRDEGLAVLKRLLEEGTEVPRFRPFLTRARAIVAEGGGVPNTILLRKHGEALLQRVSEEMQRQEAVATGLRPEDLGRGLELSDLRANPRLYQTIRELAKWVDEGRLTYAQVGGFTENELDGAYAVACRYAEMNETGKALSIVGYLIFIDPHKGRYYQLAGICTQRLKQYEIADVYYSMAEIFDRDDPMTLVYRGESQIMAGKVESGITLVRRGREIGEKVGFSQKVIQRADAILRRFGG